MKLFVVLSLLSVAFAKKTFFGDKVFTLYPTTEDQAALIRELKDEVDFWSPAYPSRVHANNHVDVRIAKFQLPKFTEMMKNAGINYEVKIEDVQQVMDEQVQKTNKYRGLATNIEAYDYYQYHTYDQINAWTKDVEASSSLVSRSVIGTSSEGREIPMLTLSTNLNNPAVLVDCGFHAREWISPAFCQCYVQQLLDDPASPLDKLTIHVVPVVNVDGYQFTWTNDRMWRKTRSNNANSVCVGVDPNRNCDAGFGGEGSSGLPCSDTYHGPYAESEPEVFAIAQFIRDNLLNLKAYVTFHAYGQMILYPYSYTYDLAATNNNLDYYAVKGYDAIRATYNKRYTYGPGAATIYPAAGGSDDYAYDAGVALSYTVELRDGGRYGFLLPEDQINPVCVETYNMMKVMEQGALDIAAGIVYES